ncbi:MAG: HAD-IIIA family hydrolase [Elusimicrobia bacterium]|nr:HAD-IIIA family hydrolase [Elusimicrobiota bacterium]
MARPRSAVFLDRDGVIVAEVDYLVDAAQLKLIPGSARAIAALRRAGLKTIVVSNQSAVARGMLSLRGLSKITKALKRMLKTKGAELDAVYYCPHHPDFGRSCACRKPGLALLKKATRRFRLDLGSCFFVGDTSTDMLTARRAGMRGLLVRTGYGGKDGKHRARPAKTFHDLAAAARWILRNSKP